MKTKVTKSIKSDQGLSKRKPLAFKKTKNNEVAMLKKDFHFQRRKQDHLKITLQNSSQAENSNILDQVILNHTAFPEMDWSEVNSSCEYNQIILNAPFYISSMTAGHQQGKDINLALAKLSSEKKILMGVGSQRRELTDTTAKNEWRDLRKKHPKALLLSNIGLSQLIHSDTMSIIGIVENLEAIGLFVHVNPLQECLQKEGTPFFKGGLKAIAELVKKSPVPVIIKEVGNGFSLEDMKRLNETGIFALDLSARGGTDWAKVEALRFSEAQNERSSGLLYGGWGYDLVEMVSYKEKLNVSYQTWGSGGIRSGLDVAKSIAMGCELVGLAQPWLKALLSDTSQAEATGNKLNEKALFAYFEKLEKELKVALFCTGSKSLKDLKGKWRLRGSLCHV